jgi:carotenoid cleavage dioxygenase-like enzyme
VTRELAIPVEHGPMIHDCAITARYVVILDLPVTFSLPAAMAGKPFPYRWNPQHRARVGLLPRTGAASDVIWCDVEPCSVFHVANAYDRADGAVIMDVCAYGTMFGPEAVGPDGAARGLERWTIDPVTGTVAIATIDATPQEFPRPDERRFGQPYRYAYAMAVPTDPAAEFIGDTRLFRHDLVEARGRFTISVRAGIRANSCSSPRRRRGGGRRLAYGLRRRHGERHHRLRGAGRDALRGSAGRRGPPAASRAGRLPRQLGAG